MEVEGCFFTAFLAAGTGAKDNRKHTRQHCQKNHPHQSGHVYAAQKTQTAAPTGTHTDPTGTGLGKGRGDFRLQYQYYLIESTLFWCSLVAFPLTTFSTLSFIVSLSFRLGNNRNNDNNDKHYYSALSKSSEALHKVLKYQVVNNKHYRLNLHLK